MLVENQLETTDRHHLGQIMTYVAGVEADTVVWIAPSFQEPHLAAVRWLNENTTDGFSFFAVKLRVVRIGDSPFAPTFEVVERPNDWERAFTAKTKVAKSGSDERNEQRLAFWQAYLDRVPSAAEWGLRPLRLSSAWVPIQGLNEEAYLSLWIGKDMCGAFMRGARGSDGQALIEELEPYADALEARLGATFSGSSGQFLWKRGNWSYNDPAQWAEAIDWMEATRKSYEQAISEIVTEAADQ